jgi:hypothetical protein
MLFERSWLRDMLINANWRNLITSYCQYSSTCGDGVFSKKPTRFLTNLRRVRLIPPCRPNDLCRSARGRAGKHSVVIGGKVSGPTISRRNAIPFGLGANVAEAWLLECLEAAESSKTFGKEPFQFVFLDLYCGFSSLAPAVRIARARLRDRIRRADARVSYVSIDCDGLLEPDVVFDVLRHGECAADVMGVPLHTPFVSHRAVHGVLEAIRLALRDVGGRTTTPRSARPSNTCLHVHASPPCTTFSKLQITQPAQRRKRKSDGTPAREAIGDEARDHDEIAASTLWCLHLLAGGCVGTASSQTDIDDFGARQLRSFFRL